MEGPLSDPSSPITIKVAEIGGNNSVLDQIMKMKQQRLKIIHEFTKEHESEMVPLMKEIEENFKKKESISKPKRKSVVPTPPPVRRSQRISCRADEEHPRITETQKVNSERPLNAYGPMPGIEIGHHWESRMHCSLDGVHRPTVAGIHGGPMGAYSIALSGGYPEDVDEGDVFTYTGAGGRDLKGTSAKPKNLRTAPQTRNQELEGVNYSLVKSIETGNPVRVIRGYKSNSVFAPESGYRYDGLYQVVKYWEDFGKTGFRIYRFKMVRMENQAPPPWVKSYKKKYSCVNNENKDPNAKQEPPEEGTDALKSPGNNNELINNVDINEETELDNEIKTCNEKLCKSWYQLSSYWKILNENSTESFHGWD